MRAVSCELLSEEIFRRPQPAREPAAREASVRGRGSVSLSRFVSSRGGGGRLGGGSVVAPALLAGAPRSSTAVRASAPAVAVDWFARSQPCHLSGCDVFISHSWHDDPADKWRALQAWRAAFKQSRGREPLVWLDIACPDQSQISDGIAHLPI
jgi:hypothetical protein